MSNNPINNLRSAWAKRVKFFPRGGSLSAIYPSAAELMLPKITSPNGKEIEVRGWDAEFFYYNLALSPKAFAKVVKYYLQKNHLDIEAIEINNAVPGLGVIKRFNQPKNQSEVCLLLPNQLLARDPGLNFEGSARFTIDRTDDAAALSLNKIMALFSVMPEKRAKALAWRFGFTPSGAIMSYSNIGQRLGLSPQAAFSQVQYGLQDLGRTGQQMKFMAARRAISCLISWSLQGNTALSLGELSQNLQSLHLLEKKAEGNLLPFLRLMDQVSGRWLRLFPGDSLDNIAQGYSHSLAGLKAEHLARYFDRQKPEEFSRGPIPARLPATLRKENPVEPAYLPLAEPVFFSNYGQAVKYCHLRDNVMVENLEQDVVLLA